MHNIKDTIMSCLYFPSLVDEENTDDLLIINVDVFTAPLNVVELDIKRMIESILIYASHSKA